MLNYFNYFTEIEQRFSQRRGSLLLLSTLDWALIEAWREAGIPLAAVLRGIEDAFDKYDARAVKSRGRLRKVNGLAWCAQSVMSAVEAMREANVGAQVTPSEPVNCGFESERIDKYLRRNAELLEAADVPAPADEALTIIAVRLRALATEITSAGSAARPDTEMLEHTLTVLEEKLFAALLLVANEDESVRLREQAARELAPYRGKMPATQLKQVTQQFLNKRLLEARKLPRLSLFYMDVA